MCQAAIKLGSIKKASNKYKSMAENLIKETVHHKHVWTVNSGNSAILSIMSALKGPILLPDQGAWGGFIKIAEFLGLKIFYLPTNRGLVNPQLLETYMEKKNYEAFFLTSFAGYTAEQPLKDIYKVSDDNQVILVEDASGAVGDSAGDKMGKLASGIHSHVILASTGSPKVVNVGNGGFISTNYKHLLNKSKDILKAFQADPVTCAGICEEIKNAPQVLSKTISSVVYLKKNLDNVFYPHIRGTNVIIPSKNPYKFYELLRSKLKVKGGSILTMCPRYERLMDDAIVLEIKNLDTRCLTIKNMDSIINIIKEVQHQVK